MRCTLTAACSVGRRSCRPAAVRRNTRRAACVRLKPVPRERHPHALSALVVRPYEMFRHLEDSSAWKRDFDAGRSTSPSANLPTASRAGARLGISRQVAAPSKLRHPLEHPSARRSGGRHARDALPQVVLSVCYRRAGQARSPALQRPPLAAPHMQHGGTSANTTSGPPPVLLHERRPASRTRVRRQTSSVRTKVSHALTGAFRPDESDASRINGPQGGAMTHVGGAWIAPIDIGSAGVTGVTRRA